jgi:hypothetical protein
MSVFGSYVTVHIPVIPLAAAQRVPLLVQFVIVHPAMLQFFVPFAFTQNAIPVTPPGAYRRVADTTELVATAVLFVVLESLGLVMVQVKLTVDPDAAGCGITGILKVSVASDAILVVFVHVTVDPICAPQDHQLSIKALVGPVMLAGNVNVLVCTPLEARFPALVTVIGTWDKYVIVSGPSGCPIPGMRSGTLAATYGKSLHSTAPE